MLRTFLKNWVVFLAALWFAAGVFAKGPAPLDSIAVADLPTEAQYTLQLLKEGKPLPYAKDGVVFGNYEGVLPKRKRGYYHEYTVKTPGVRHRGARRIIAGGEQGQFREFFYTDDHYVSFKRIRE